MASGVTCTANPVQEIAVSVQFVPGMRTPRSSSARNHPGGMRGDSKRISRLHRLRLRPRLEIYRASRCTPKLRPMETHSWYGLRQYRESVTGPCTWLRG
eukprot:2053835-Rhodomonas_salina.1